MANERELRIKYAGDASSLRRTLGTIESAHRSFGSRLASIGKAVGKVALVGAAAATVALAGVGKAAITAAQEAERVGAQTAAAIESTGAAANVTAGDVAKLSTEIMRYSGLSDEAVQSSANVLLTFTQIKNRVGEGNDVFNQATAAVADLSVAMGKDMNSAAVMVGKALNNPIAGITALTRVGVQFTEQQKKQIAAMVEAGDVAGAQKLILAELTKEFGGSAKALGETSTGQFNILKETVGNALEEVGAKLLDVGVKVLPALTKTLTGLVNTIGPVLGDFFAGIAKTLGALLPAIAPVLAAFGEAIGEVLTALGPALGQVVKALAPTLGELASALADILVALVPILPPLADLIAAFAPLIPMVARLVAGLVKLLVPALSAIVKVLTVVVKAVVGFVGKWETAWETVKAVALTVWGAIRSAAATIWGAIETVILEPVRAVKDVILGVWQGIRETLRGIWEGLKSTALNIWGGIVAGIKAALNLAVGAINMLIRNANRVSGALDFALGPAFNWADIPQIPTLAHGGTIRTAGLAVVGERGPELLNLPRGAQVIPGESGRRPIVLRARLDVRLDRARFGREEEIAIATVGW